MARKQATTAVRYERVEAGEQARVGAEVITEAPVSLTVNGVAWLSFMCTPVDLEALAVGFLFNEGVISRREEVAAVEVCARGDNVDVLLDRPVCRPPSWRRTSGCVGGFTAVEPAAGDAAPAEPGDLAAQALRSDPLRLEAGAVHRLLGALFGGQNLYAQTGGVHSSALADGDRIVVAAEDIGRHNTLDKLAGRCLLDGLAPARRVLLTTGRVSSDMLQKAARLRAPVVVSRSSPTSLSIELADRWGITLVGYVRRDGFNVYTHAERIVPDRPGATRLAAAG